MEVEGLSVVYKRARDRAGAPDAAAVRDVSFSLPAGQTLALVGESGSGKSSVAMAILSYLPAGARREARVLRLGPHDLLAAGEGDLRRLRGRRIAAVYQNPGMALNPSLSIGRQVAEILEVHLSLPRAEALRETERLLGEVQIREPRAVMDLFAHQISGGMQQRVSIAMAMALEPALIVLDEPTTALDVTVQRQTMDLLADLQRRRGTSYLLITHDIHLASVHAHEIAVMRAGEIVETGTYAQLRDDARHPYTRQLLGSVLAKDPRPEARPGAPAILKVEGLEHGFSKAKRGRPAVEDVSLVIKAGETLGLVGESGSGKTTIGKLICGIHDRQAGAIELNGRALPTQFDRRGPSDRGAIRMVFQSPDATLNPAHTIGAILRRALAIAGAGDPKAEAAALMERVRLPAALESRRPAELSGGQKQRVAIARAFASSPRLVVLDEPTSALDASVQKEILALLVELQKERTVGYLLITHDLDVVAEMAHHVAVLKAGRIVETGATRRILSAPEHGYTRELLASRLVPPAATAPARPGAARDAPWSAVSQLA
ncbi:MULTISPECIES: ATP-binding cassette domain-containing protein [unclassified Aureimonas]|uniref:ATP-binding cassette domain-containing protein n=1 Tax=unclassified Aureimonas TaxID=2615206 RepID=UPI0006F6BD36|nr:MULTISPECIES: ABC transporter ATP-binding protein [unclassified Aureimonas]KQT69007.1 hypothetical protein ASG54_04940 [Aureimonas sp. Leaf460]KQT69237.1 hypothetical protein ASG62_17545 [Aureimonas sp. Leaf427]